MAEKTILLLGGYGHTGVCLAELILKETDVRLIVAGRSADKSREASARWNSLFPGQRVEGLSVDAADGKSLRSAIQHVDMALVASSSARHARLVAEACLESGCDYLDIQYSSQKYASLQGMAEQTYSVGLCFITEAGFHPGLPLALVRYVSSYFDALTKAIVSSAMKMKLEGPMPDSIYELIESFRDYQPLVIKEGRLTKSSQARRVDFQLEGLKVNLGTKLCFPMELEEMRFVGELFPSIKEAGFYVAGFNWFVDWLVTPITMTALKLCPEMAVSPMAKLFYWGVKTFTLPPFCTAMKVEAEGIKVGKPKKLTVFLCHEDEYVFTAIPVVACLLQYLDGSARKPGLHLMGQVVEPNRLLNDMKRMGIDVSVEEK